MKHAPAIILPLLLASATNCLAQVKVGRIHTTTIEMPNWQQYDSLARIALVQGDTSTAINYLEAAAVHNNALKPFLYALRKKYVQAGNSFYLKEY